MTRIVKDKINIIHTEFVGVVKMLNFTFYELTVVKTEIVILFLCLFNYNYALQKNDFTKVCQFFTCKCIFGVGYALQLRGHILQEGGWDTGVGRSSSNYSNIWNHIEKPLARLKFSKKSFWWIHFNGKYIQLLLIK
jgi:hypothetical protein